MTRWKKRCKAGNQRNALIEEQKMNLPPKNAAAAKHQSTQKDLENRSFFYTFLITF